MIKRMVKGKELDMSAFVYGTGNGAKLASMQKTLFRSSSGECWRVLKNAPPTCSSVLSG